MKLSGLLWGALAVLGALVLYANWQQNVAASRWQTYRDSLAALTTQIQIADAEQVQRDAERRRYQAIVDSLSARLPTLPPVRATLPPAAPKPGTASDSAAYWRARSDTLEAAYRSQIENNRSLREYAGNLTGQLKATAALLAISEHSDSVHTAQRDQALAVAHQAPAPRKRGISLLGVRLCPEVGVGYAATLHGGVLVTGPTVAVVQPLRCGG